MIVLRFIRSVRNRTRSRNIRTRIRIIRSRRVNIRIVIVSCRCIRSGCRFIVRLINCTRSRRIIGQPVCSGMCSVIGNGMGGCMLNRFVSEV